MSLKTTLPQQLPELTNTGKIGAFYILWVPANFTTNLAVVSTAATLIRVWVLTESFKIKLLTFLLLVSKEILSKEVSTYQNLYTGLNWF